MDQAIVVVGSIIGAVICVSIAAVAAARSDCAVAIKAIESIARQPEAKNTILVTMLISVGLIESIPIIAAVIAIVLVFANPFIS